MMKSVWLVQDIEKDDTPMVFATKQAARKAVADMTGLSVDDEDLDGIMDGYDNFISVKEETVRN